MSDTLDVPVTFGHTAATVAADGAMRVTVPTDRGRDASLAARLHRPGVVRDALLAMGDVLSSDARQVAALALQRGSLHAEHDDRP